MYNTEETSLSADDAKRFIDHSLSTFHRNVGLGPTGVLQQAEIAFWAWKHLDRHDRERFEMRLYRHFDKNHFRFLCELGRRRAMANAVAYRFSAAAELHILSQQTAGFDGFLTKASTQEAMAAYQLISTMIDQRTSPR